jgi:hypothetical protein
MATSLAPNRLQPMGHYRAIYDVVLPTEVTVDEAMKPEFWANVGAKLRQHDVICLFPEDGSKFVEVIVLNAGRGFAKVAPIREVNLSTDDPIDEDGAIYVKWQGPHNKHAVIRRSDGEPLKNGFQTKAEAQRWASDYLAAQAR